MTEAEQIMKRCQVGTRSHEEANNLHAACYGIIGRLLAQEPPKYSFKAHWEKDGRIGVVGVVMRPDGGPHVLQDTIDPPEPEHVACERCKQLEEQAYDLLGQLKVANLKLSVRSQRTEQEPVVRVICKSEGSAGSPRRFEAQPEQEPDGIALTSIPHPQGVSAPDDLNADALEVVELELPDECEAVGWADDGVINWIAGKQFKHASFLYPNQQQRTWVGLTDEDWDEIFGNALTIGEAIKETEAKLKQKNGYAEEQNT